MGSKWTIGVAAALMLIACGESQTGADYPGEPLMQLQGRITAVGAQLDSGAVPGLSFDMNGTKWDQKTHFVAGEVEGTFPSEFTMRVYEPPPDEALITIAAGQARIASGTIVAANPDHPAWLRSTWLPGEAKRRCASTGECRTSTPTSCAQPTADPLLPCLESTPDLAPDEWRLYGTADYVSVLYFDADVPAGSLVSKALLNGGAASAGYFVFAAPTEEEVASVPEDVLADFTACADRAKAAAIQAFNQKQHTSYADFDAIWQELNDTPEAGALDNTVPIMKAWTAEDLRAIAACTVDGVGPHPVSSDRPINIRMFSVPFGTTLHGP